MPDKTEDPLLIALKSRDAASLADLLAAGRSWDERFRFDRTPLHLAAASGAEECARLLVARGANLEALDEAGESPLIHALSAGQVETAAALIELGARLAYGFTPTDSPDIREKHRQLFEDISAASRVAYPEIYRILDDPSVDIDWDAIDASTTDFYVGVVMAPREIHAVHHCTNLEALQLLFRQPGITFDLHDGAGYWPLKSFAESGDDAVLAWLLDHGATPDFTSTGETALHAAVRGNHRECVRRLLAAGANPNQQDVDGQTPMFGATSEAMLALLLAHGADPNIRDQASFTHADWVERRQRPIP